MKSLLPPELQAKWDVRDTVPRRDRFRELAFAGYRIPRCGIYADMRRLGVPLVVYTDELAHCGEGKALWKPGDEVRWPKSAFCSEYVPDRFKEDGSRSHRELVVGFHKFVIVYTSSQSWMSNVDGEYSVEYHAPADRDHDLMPYPMYAIDSAIHQEAFYHFDLNVCPGVPLEVVNMVGRDVLQQSVAKLCRDRGLIS